MPELDRFAHDYYGFLADGLVSDAAPLESIATFYTDPSWPTRFARYDAAYPGEQAARDADVARALAELARRGV